MLRTFEEPGLATTAALAAEEAEATGSFGAELLQALFEQGPLGCRELLRIGERYPYLRPTLSAFLQKHPGLHWMQLVGEEQFASRINRGVVLGVIDEQDLNDPRGDSPDGQGKERKCQQANINAQGGQT